jgi:hypothetical protein
MLTVSQDEVKRFLMREIKQKKIRAGGAGEGGVREM